MISYSMECKRCKGEPVTSDNVKDVSLFFDRGVNIGRMDCPNCKTCIALNLSGVWTYLDELLNDNKRNGIFMANTLKEFTIHYILSQIFHKENENISGKEKMHFDLPDSTDVVMILWKDGTAVGYYTIKPKGTLIESTMEMYSMPTLDSIYIQPEYRRKGYCLQLLEHLTEGYLDQNIGFSYPLSSNMKKVLKKYLLKNPGLREKLWLINRTGNEGNRKMIWYSLKTEEKKK